MGRKPEPLPLPDDATVTQFGEDGPMADGFRDLLRLEIGETELSMIWGDVDADVASLMVTQRLVPGRACRKTLVGILRDAGFNVIHSPSRGNPLHVSVYPPNDSEGSALEWGADLAKQFNNCFTDW